MGDGVERGGEECRWITARVGWWVRQELYVGVDSDEVLGKCSGCNDGGDERRVHATATPKGLTTFDNSGTR